MGTNEKEHSALWPFRVLDLTDQTGGFCTKALAALGADVIVVEPPGGHPSRRIGPFYHDEPDPEKSLHWFTYNLNKRSITLNIECATGQELFKRLVRTADFVVECFRPGYLDRLGLGYAELSATNPRIILTSITPWGLMGPYSQFKSSNLVCSAVSGFMSVCGDEDRPPVQVSTPVAYIMAGLVAATASMVAHWHRERTGEGQHVDVSAQEALMLQNLPYSLWLKGRGVIPVRTNIGATVPLMTRHQRTFECKDGLVISATTVSRGRQPLRDWLASEGLAGDLFDSKWDPIFVDGRPVSKEQKEHIDGLVQALASKYTRDEFMFQAQKRKIQATKVQGVDDVMRDQHLQEREYFVEVEHPEIHDSIVYAGAPFKSDELFWRYWRRAPFIGEHNREIYMEGLGISRQELVVLKEEGVI